MAEGLAEERKVTSIVEKGISNLGGGGGQYDAHSINFFCHTFYATQTMEPIVYYFPLLHNEYDNLFRCNFIMLRCAILAE